jgi:hypothetical protein
MLAAPKPSPAFHISARVPGAEYLTDEHAGGPASVTLYGPPAQPSPHSPFPAASPPGIRLGSGRTWGMHAQLSRERQADTTPVRGPSVAASPVRGPSVAASPVRGRPRKADGPSYRAHPTDAVCNLSVDPATQRPTARQGDTRLNKEETPR